MGPQVRMAASLSINKRKTYAADTADVVAARRAEAARPCEPQWRSPTAARLGLSRFCPMTVLWTSRRGG